MPYIHRSTIQHHPPPPTFFTKCFCQHGVGRPQAKRPPSPLTSSRGVRRNEGSGFALNSVSITQSRSSSSSPTLIFLVGAIEYSMTSQDRLIILIHMHDHWSSWSSPSKSQKARALGTGHWAFCVNSMGCLWPGKREGETKGQSAEALLP